MCSYRMARGMQIFSGNSGALRSTADESHGPSRTVKDCRGAGALGRGLARRWGGENECKHEMPRREGDDVLCGLALELRGCPSAEVSVSIA